MIIYCIIAGLALVGFVIGQNRLDIRRRSGAFILDDGGERWVVDFTIGMMYYRYFYKVPHPTDRYLGLDYEIRLTHPLIWRGCGVTVEPPETHLWEMRLTKESHDLAHRDAVDRLLNPSGLSEKSRNRVSKEIQIDLLELGPEPTWKPVPPWLIGVLESRHKVFLRYPLAYEEGIYQNHPGRVEDIKRYLTRDGSPTCSNGSKGGSQSKRYLKIYGTASSTAGRRVAPKRRDSRVLVG